MNEYSLNKKLSKLNIGGLRYFETIGSTNDEALAWAAGNAPDLSLVVADEQTRGRGRLNRTWFTPPRSALAVTMILRPDETMRANLSRVVGLAALALTTSCAEFGLAPRIKWPNDILVDGKKIAGILVETVWSGADVDSLVIGMGINVHKESVPPVDHLHFPASSIEDALRNTPPAREDILYHMLSALIELRGKIHTRGFLQSWENLLAFRGEQIQIRGGDESSLAGELVGLESDGSLRLRDSDGRLHIARFGDVSLRPMIK